MSEIIRVKDVMTDEVIFVHGRDTLQEGLKKIRNSSSQVLIIDKRHDDDEYGIVCMADIARKVIALDKSPERINLYEIMSKPVLCVKDAMDVRYCARMFEQFHLHSAPVVNHAGGIVGVVSYEDMVFKGLVNSL